MPHFSNAESQSQQESKHRQLKYGQALLKKRLIEMSEESVIMG